MIPVHLTNVTLYYCRYSSFPTLQLNTKLTDSGFQVEELYVSQILTWKFRAELYKKSPAETPQVKPQYMVK